MNATFLKTWCKEPLLHFLLIGAALFGLQALLQPRQLEAPSARRIVMSQGDIERPRLTTGLPRVDVPLALFLFNVGVEIGQMACVALILLLKRSFRVLELRWPRWVELIPGYAVGALGAYWTIERTFALIGWI